MTTLISVFLVVTVKFSHSFFSGNERDESSTKQVPKLFKTKKECAMHIIKHKQYAKSFNEKHKYHVIPIDISE